MECTASNQCHDGGTCDPATGICSGPAKPDGTPCSDGDACSTGDTCLAGLCVGGPAPNCEDANECTDDICDVSLGCLNINNSIGCDDGDACTTNDACSGGGCVGGAPLNCDDANICTDDSCDSLTGCANAENTASCDDGDICTVLDLCSGGNCVAGDARNLSAATISGVLKPGADDDRLSIRATVDAADIGVLPTVGGLEFVVVTPGDAPVYLARVEAADFVDLRGRGIKFKYKDKTASRPDKLLFAMVKIITKKGIAKVKAKARGWELGAAVGQPYLSTSVIFGDATSGDCLTALQAICRESATKVKCKMKM